MPTQPQPTDKDDPFKIEFALNRAVFFKQLTEAQADNGIKALAALEAVAVAAEKHRLAKIAYFTENSNTCETYGPMKSAEYELDEALSTLAAIRKEGGK